jgi:hypothetical protein
MACYLESYERRMGLHVLRPAVVSSTARTDRYLLCTCHISCLQCVKQYSVQLRLDVAPCAVFTLCSKCFLKLFTSRLINSLLGAHSTVHMLYFAYILCMLWQRDIASIGTLSMQ